MARRDVGRSGLLAVLSMVLLELGVAACGGQTGEDGAGGGVSGSLGGSPSNESGAGGAGAGEPSASAGGRATGGATGTAGDVHCQEPWDAGPCDAEIPVFWFDVATNRCEPRTYGGCEGNANRFDTLVSCEQDCAEVRGPGSAPLPVVYAFGDRCDGDALSADGRRIVAEFVVDQPHDPPGDDPYVLVDLMAGNALCARMSDVVLNGVGVEAFVDYYEYGEQGYLPVHEAEVPVAAITLDLGELSAALGVEPPAVEWR